MKYSDYELVVPFEKRKSYNQKITALILSGDMQGIIPEEVYNLFTGKGNLHGLDLENFDNYYEYSCAKKEIEQGQFFTPHALCAAIIQALRPPDHARIVDMTCGIGNFFNHLSYENRLYGNEIEEAAFSVCHFLYPEAHIHKGDFVYYEPEVKFDLVLGNPPFNLSTSIGASQYAYLKKAEQLLQYGGLLAVIVPESFLADSFQEARKIEWLDEHFNFITQCPLPTDSFNAVIDTKLLLLQKKGVTNSNKKYDEKEITPFEPDSLYEQWIAPLYKQNQKDAPRITLFSVQQSVESHSYQYLIKRRLWHIKENKTLHDKYYQQAIEKLDKLRTQRKPDEMSDKDWEAKKLTPVRVYNWMNAIVRRQNDPPPEEKFTLVKTNYGISLKSYHRKLAAQGWHKSIHDLLRTGELFAPYDKLYRRKKKALDLQLMPFTDLPRDTNVDKFLNDFVLTPVKEKNAPLLLFEMDPKPTIHLNDKQKHDLGLALQKKYCLLAWEQGGGKSVAGMCWIRFHQGKYLNVFLLAPALAVETTWMERLTWYGFDFIHLTTISDFAAIRPGQVVLISHERMVELQWHIRKYLKRQGYKIALLVDESDELTNANSQRSRTALKCFRKARLKLLTTGTTTRNNINEIYTQMELLYNNSTVFTCWAQEIYHVNKDNEIEAQRNENAGYPFPAYRGGALFKASFCPQKSTVFGIRKDSQDVYNAGLLKELLNFTVITRKFEEITGEKKHSIHTHDITQTSAERVLYELLLKDFLQVCYDYYISTGVARKEAALRLVRQIKVLIKASSIPNLMPNYTGNGLPGKCEAIIALTDTWKNERVTIGTIFKETARYYYQQLQQHAPERRIFYIDGECNVAKRKKILEQFHVYPNGILICTQQSLKSSVNIPFCKKCIIESLQWNIPRMAQFYFRFIRFDSIGNTEVHFVNYHNTIEANLMALLMAKEKLNDFIKTTNATTTEAIYEEFGFDLNILESLIQKQYDGDGHLYLSWGNQRIGGILTK
jgi:hypothetical protein